MHSSNHPLNHLTCYEASSEDDWTNE